MAEGSEKDATTRMLPSTTLQLAVDHQCHRTPASRLTASCPATTHANSGRRMTSGVAAHFAFPDLNAQPPPPHPDHACPGRGTPARHQVSPLSLRRRGGLGTAGSTSCSPSFALSPRRGGGLAMASAPRKGGGVGRFGRPMAGSGTGGGVSERRGGASTPGGGDDGLRRRRPMGGGGWRRGVECAVRDEP